MADRVVTFGEILLRLTAPGNERFTQARTFNATYGGCEANVAVSLCSLGIDTAFVSMVPKNSMGDSAINHLRQFGVDTKNVIRGGQRLGIYFLETGASVRPSRVIYDRAGSAISAAEISDFNFDDILEGATWFHTTGITPALSNNAARLTKIALKTARKKGITTSLDLNYRQKLWNLDKAKRVIFDLLEDVDVMIDAGVGSRDASETFFGISKQTFRYDTDDNITAGYRDVFEAMIKKFGFKYVATTLRDSISASENGLSAMIMGGNEFYRTRKYNVNIVDRVGGGDSFAAGLIYGILKKMKIPDMAEFAMAASALKHTICGDQNLSVAEEIVTLMGGDGSGRVER